MPVSSKSFKCSVELTIHVVDAPGTQMRTNNDLYLNICLLGQHQRTRLVRPFFPLIFNQTFFFEKIFKAAYDPRDILQRLEREHVLIELLQAEVPGPILLANFETSAKDFLYQYSSSRLQYVGLPRHVLLNRTIQFPGLAPSIQLTVSPSIFDLSGTGTNGKTRRARKPINSHGKSPKRAKSPSARPSSAYANGSTSTIVPANLSHSLTSHTISSAVKSDYGHREIQDKLQELAVPGEVKYVLHDDKTLGRRPFVVRHVNENLIGRQPKSHFVLNDGLIINDYSFSRPTSSVSIHSVTHSKPRSRSPSSSNSRARSASGHRTRSPSPARRSILTSKSMDFEHRHRSSSPFERSNFQSTQPFENYRHYENHADELHPTNDCDICRLHSIHTGQSQRAKLLDQQQFASATQHRSYLSDLYPMGTSRFRTSPTLVRDSFRHRYHRSPAVDLSDKVIHTLRRNVDSYSDAPRPRYYSAFRYSDAYKSDDE